MISFTIKVDTAQASRIIADRLNVKVPKVLGESVKTTTDKVASTAQSNAPVDTGELRGSIKGEVVSEFEGRVIATAEHAPYVEFGTVQDGGPAIHGSGCGTAQDAVCQGHKKQGKKRRGKRIIFSSYFIIQQIFNVLDYGCWR